MRVGNHHFCDFIMLIPDEEQYSGICYCVIYSIAPLPSVPISFSYIHIFQQFILKIYILKSRDSPRDVTSI